MLPARHFSCKNGSCRRSLKKRPPEAAVVATINELVKFWICRLDCLRGFLPEPFACSRRPEAADQWGMRSPPRRCYAASVVGEGVSLLSRRATRVMMETTPKSAANIQMSQKIVKQNLQTVYPGVLGADRKQRCSTPGHDSHDPHDSCDSHDSLDKGSRGGVAEFVLDRHRQPGYRHE